MLPTQLPTNAAQVAEQVMAQVPGHLSHRDPHGALGSQLLPGPAPVIVGIWKVNQLVEDFLFLSLFVPHFKEIKNFLKKLL